MCTILRVAFPPSAARLTLVTANFRSSSFFGRAAVFLVHHQREDLAATPRGPLLRRADRLAVVLREQRRQRIRAHLRLIVIDRHGKTDRRGEHGERNKNGHGGLPDGGRKGLFSNGEIRRTNDAFATPIPPFENELGHAPSGGLPMLARGCRKFQFARRLFPAGVRFRRASRRPTSSGPGEGGAAPRRAGFWAASRGRVRYEHRAMTCAGPGSVKVSHRLKSA